MKNKITLKRNEILEFMNKLIYALVRSQSGNKGFKRTLFHHCAISSETVIQIHLDDLITKPLDSEKSKAFCTVIERYMSDTIASVRDEVSLNFLTDLNVEQKFKYTPSVYSDSLDQHVKFKTYQSKAEKPMATILPRISMELLPADWETDRTLWLALSVIYKFLYHFDNNWNSFDFYKSFALDNNDSPDNWVHYCKEGISFLDEVNESDENAILAE